VDVSLEEIKTMKYVGLKDPNDKQGIVQLVDCFYFQVAPLLGALSRPAA
jgi:hypothetical protein